MSTKDKKGITMKKMFKAVAVTVMGYVRGMNNGRKLKNIIRFHLKENGYKTKAIFIPTSYRNGFVHLRAGNKNKEFIELRAKIEGKDSFFAGDVRVVTNSIIPISKNTWQAENDEKITHYVF